MTQRRTPQSPEYLPATTPAELSPTAAAITSTTWLSELNSFSGSARHETDERKTVSEQTGRAYLYRLGVETVRFFKQQLMREVTWTQEILGEPRGSEAAQGWSCSHFAWVYFWVRAGAVRIARSLQRPISAFPFPRSSHLP